MIANYSHFRNDLAIALVKIYAARPSLDEVLVERAFDVADRMVARIDADQTAFNAELEAQRAKDMEELINSMRPGKIEAVPPLRRAEDKVEVREVSAEQALDMIMSIFRPKQ